jgi:hypothetical protein
VAEASEGRTLDLDGSGVGSEVTPGLGVRLPEQGSTAVPGGKRKEWGNAQLVEIPLVVGHYTMLSMLANASGVPLEPGLPPLPAEPGG